MDDPAAVLDFWFGQPPKAWFTKDIAFDGEIRRRFGDTYEAARARRLDAWLEAPRGCLAYIILLDQFPRNMFRGEAAAFATDPLALSATRRMLESGWDRGLGVDERTFAYLPLEHSEVLDDQDLCCELMRPLGDEVYRYALRHRDIIRRFGRFPHRNATLGRASTPEEVEFLKQPGSGF